MRFSQHLLNGVCTRPTLQDIVFITHTRICFEESCIVIFECPQLFVLKRSLALPIPNLTSSRKGRQKQVGAMDASLSTEGTGAAADVETSIAGPLLILAPPGSGKTKFYERKMQAGELPEGLHDADDILSEVIDRATQKPVIDSQDHYKDWNKWMRVCFRELLNKMNTEPERYKIIMSGFMVPKLGADEYNMKYVQWGYSQFIGTGNITSWRGVPEENFPKIEPKRVRVVLPEMEEYKKDAIHRIERPVPPAHCARCWECLAELARDYELQTFSSVEAAVAAK